MWEFIVRQLLKEVARQPSKAVGRNLAAGLFADEANGPEKYADRIKRDFRLPHYADAWALYESYPAYWERYYNPPPADLPANKMIVQDSAARAGVPSRNNVFEYGFPEPSPRQPSKTAVTQGLSPLSDFFSRPWVTPHIRDSATRAGIPSRYNTWEYGYPDSTSSLPGTSAAVTEVHTPQRIADFLTKYVFPPPGGPDWRKELVRDSAAAAGVPGRNNVFEYGFPETGSARSSVFDAGASPVPSLPSGLPKTPRGIPGLIAEAGSIEPSDPAAPPAGGMADLIQQYLRNNYRAYR